MITKLRKQVCFFLQNYQFFFLFMPCFLSLVVLHKKRPLKYLMLNHQYLQIQSRPLQHLHPCLQKLLMRKESQCAWFLLENSQWEAPLLMPWRNAGNLEMIAIKMLRFLE
ncbi:MAG: hypothetical protein DRO01_03920 [Thermoproteota archaeon]|nr:MAG: hypothetical protein DRO01_03920 [Candidatus Korarchaeota archaeon]